MSERNRRLYTSDELRSAYEAGLRRAQELAKEHVVPYVGLVIDRGWLEWTAFDRAIDAEVAKEGK